MKYFVTGATGFIGSHVAKQLVRDGHEVVALVRTLNKGTSLRNDGITLAEGDITDKESMRAPMTGVDGVFHIAGWYKIGVRDKTPAHRINVDGTRNVLELIQELNIPKGVYTSTVAVFSDTKGQLVDETYRYEGPHLSEYDRTKWLAHYKVAEPMIRAGLPLVIVMPGAVYGPGDTSSVGETMEQYLKGKLPILPKGTALCWAHIEDTARGHILAMERGTSGESYIIAGQAHSLVDIFNLAEQFTGVKAPSVRVSPGLLKAMSAMIRPIDNILPLPDSYTSEGLRVVAGVTYLGNNAKAKKELGFDPRPIQDGLPPTLFALMQRLGMPLPEK